MQIIELDFETQSLVDLKKAGAERYSRDPSTNILCLTWYNDPLWWVWSPLFPCELATKALMQAASDPNIMFVAHNAGFEEAIWRNIMVPGYKFPPMPLERWDCTMAACAVRGYPLKLEFAAAWSGVQKKDMSSSKFTVDLSRAIGHDPKTGTTRYAKWSKLYDVDGNRLLLQPNGDRFPPITARVRDWHQQTVNPEDLTNVVVPYCKQDVVTEKQVLNRVGILHRDNKPERNVWLLDQRMNHRGVPLDLALVHAMDRVVKASRGPLLQKFQTLTGLSSPGSPKLLGWCEQRGVKLPNLQKATIDNLIARYVDGADTDDIDYSLAGNDDEGRWDWLGLPPDVKQALEWRALLAGAAVKKIPAMLACICEDGRAYGVTQYYAAHTGRWGGRLFQPQNFPRQSAGDDPERVVAAILSGDPAVVERELGLPALVAVARALRHAIIAPPGKRLVVGDYKSIEAVIVLALAGHRDLAKQLSDGLPIYMNMAEQIYNQPKGTWAVADKELYKQYKELDHVQEYTIGKNTILGCGFQMGDVKFHARYCPEQPVEFAQRVVKTYRKDFAPKVEAMWYDIDRAALAAAHGQPSESHGITYEIRGDWMVGHLPNGWQKLWYPRPRMGIGKFGKECWVYARSQMGQGNSGEQKGAVVQMYGGLETENYVQALARGVMVGALARLDAAGWNPILTCHDEIMCEVDEDQVDMVCFDKMMKGENASNPWISRLGLPIEVESWNGKRYKK